LRYYFNYDLATLGEAMIYLLMWAFLMWPDGSDPITYGYKTKPICEKYRVINLPASRCFKYYGH
jgi:hypothetical protein